jgi:ankyrin repeat protein/mono/diheme cytochrome c family protein
MKTFTTFAILLLGWLTFDLPAVGAPSAAAEKLFQGIRAGDRAIVRSLLKDGADVQARDADGDTPLMSAALNADAALLEVLLKAGADVNATNKAGATALMRAATDERKVRLLLKHGADLKARSGLGNSALILAARKPGNGSTVRLLVEGGAPVNAANVFGATPLMAAVAAQDTDTVRLLLERGADMNAKPNMDDNGFLWGGGRTPLMWAAFLGNEALVKLLLERGAKVDDFAVVGSALTQAGWAGHAGVAKLLLEAGAQVDQRDLVANYTPLHWAASSERADPALVDLLIARHADVNAEGGQPVDGFLGVTQTPLMLARKRGETPIVQALLKAGARDVATKTEKRLPKPARASADTSDDSAVAAAIQLAIPSLQRTAVESPATFLKHASKQACISCHQQSLPLSALSLARSRGFAVDEAAVKKTVERTDQFAGMMHELELQAVFHPEPAIGNGYSLMSLQFERQPASALTDSQVHHLSVIQQPDGSWAWNLPRPPIQSSAIGATALGVQALKHYGIPGRQREFDERVQRARAWLGKAQAESAEERAYQLLGLAWAGERTGKLKPLTEALIREQRSDGGWGQLANLPSDAFATGQALYALLGSGQLPGRHEVVQKGVRFLLRNQLEDGTWHIARRAFPFQPPMDSGFAHGADGWVSAAGSSWAVMALVSALDPAYAPKPASTIAQVSASASVSSAAVGTAAGPVEFKRDIQPLLERSCVACHSGERAKGGFQMVNRESLLQGGKRGDPVIVAGHSSQSALLRLVTDQVEDLEMPPLGKREKFPALTKDEIARLSAWIEQGAVWPEGVSLQASAH